MISVHELASSRTIQNRPGMIGVFLLIFLLENGADKNIDETRSSRFIEMERGGRRRSGIHHRSRGYGGWSRQRRLRVYLSCSPVCCYGMAGTLRRRRYKMIKNLFLPIARGKDGWMRSRHSYIPQCPSCLKPSENQKKK